MLIFHYIDVNTILTLLPELKAHFLLGYLFFYWYQCLFTFLEIRLTTELY